MTINSRNKGNAYERQIINEIKALGFDAVSSRSESKNMDDAGVDIITELPFNIQCKRVERLHDPEGIIENMPPDKIRAIFTKKNRKDDLVILKKSDFYRIIMFTLLEKL